jgi:hypothetical protein
MGRRKKYTIGAAVVSRRNKTIDRSLAAVMAASNEYAVAMHGLKTTLPCLLVRAVQRNVDELLST